MDSRTSAPFTEISWIRAGLFTLAATAFVLTVFLSPVETAWHKGIELPVAVWLNDLLGNNTLGLGTLTSFSATRVIPVIALCLLGGFLGSWLSGLTLSLTLAGISVALCLLGPFANVRTTYFPWVSHLFALWSVAGVVFLERARVFSIKAHRIRTALDGLVPEEKIHELLKDNSDLTEPKTQVATVMFIDIVGFFLTAENKPADEVFYSLRRLLDSLTKIVHQHDGIVDQTIGDGMLCFFGFSYGNGASDPAHANKAVRCSIDIQRKVLERNLQAAQIGDPIYPLRIGINTGSVFVGDLGSGERLDLTILGQTINLAKRFEITCDDYCVLIGAETRDLLTEVPGGDVRFTKRSLQLKHYDDLLEAFEIDPLVARSKDRTNAINAFREYLGKERRHARWAVPEGVEIFVTAAQKASGLLVNFSQSGLAVKLDVYLAREVSVTFQLSTTDGLLQERLRADHLLPITGVIRWGRPLADGQYLHGIEITSMDEQSAKRFLHLLRTTMSVEIPQVVNE